MTGLPTLAPMKSLQRSLLHGRRAAVVVFGLFVLAGLVLVFAGSLTRSTDLEAEAARMEAEIARMEEQVAAGEAELRFIQTDAFHLWRARAEGYGEAGEIRFALPPGAPSPEPVVPLGPSRSSETTRAPFDAWMDLLFGS